MSIFLERIKQFAKHKDLSLRQISLGAGLSAAYLSNSLKQGSAPSIEIMSKIIDNYPNLNPYWVLTGKGNMIIDSENVTEESAFLNQSKTIDEIIDEKIEVKLKTMGEAIREIMIGEITAEIEATRKALKAEKNNGKVS